MFKTLLSTILVVCALQGTFAQQMPIDFEINLDTFNGFSGSNFQIAADPQNSNNKVGRFNNNGAVDFQGFYIDLDREIDLAFNQVISLKFLATDANSHTILMKLENGTEPDVQVSIDVPQGSQNVWRTVQFDFNNAQYSSGAGSLSAMGAYDRLTLFIDSNQAVSGNFLIDDIDDGSIETDLNQIDVEYTTLVWSDEFNEGDQKLAVNNNNWHHQTQIPAGGNWFNGEEQHYTDRLSNSYVQDGFLHIVARREQFTDQGVTKSFTSARLNSKFAFTYGRVDVLAKLPEGSGTWPAIWTLGKDVNEDGGYWDEEFGTTNWPASGEIDIMEHGLGAVNQVSSALHSPCQDCFGNTKNYKSIFIEDVSENFHLFSLNWSPDQITFLVDNVAFYTYNPSDKNDANWPFDKDHYLLLNVALGGISGAIAPDFQQSPMIVDYVRVYQNSTLSTPTLKDSKFNIFPNPASDKVYVKSLEPIDTMQLYNVLGVEVAVSFATDYSFTVEGLPSGMYFLKITSGETAHTSRVMVQ